MSLSPDTTPASALETLSRPVAHRSKGCLASAQLTSPIDAQITATPIATAFHSLLDAPDLDAETVLVESATPSPITSTPEKNTLETAIEASAWLPSNIVEIMPAAEPASTAPFTPQTTVPVLDITTLTASETLLAQTSVEPEILPLPMTQTAKNTPTTSVSNLPITEIFAPSAVPPMALNPAALPLFLLSEPMAAPVAPVALPVPNVQHLEFAQGMATHLTWLANQSIGQAHIQINPPHLGAVEINLHLHDQQLHAAFFSPHHEVCQRLQESLPVLHRLLDEHGVHLVHADVNQQASYSDTHANTAKTPAMPDVIQHNTAADTEEEQRQYQPTTLLDTWA